MQKPSTKLVITYIGDNSDAGPRRVTVGPVTFPLNVAVAVDNADQSYSKLLRNPHFRCTDADLAAVSPVSGPDAFARPSAPPMSEEELEAATRPEPAKPAPVPPGASARRPPAPRPLA